MFIDINHEQRSVKRNLLHELFAELNWDAEDESKRVGAVVSKAIQTLDDRKDSPFQGRILLADDTRTPLRCISLESMMHSLNQPGMFIVKKNIEYGPLWAGDNDRMVKRTISIVKGWFDFIREGAADWWNMGSGEGGGLAMNDGVTICFGVLKSVFQDLGKSRNLVRLSNEELLSLLAPLGACLGSYLGSLSFEQRDSFRAGARGVQGQTAGRRQCEGVLHEKFPDFDPPGLKEALRLQDEKTNEKAYPIIQEMETALSHLVIDTLKGEFGEGEGEPWWTDGVPEKIRIKCQERREQDKGRLPKEGYFDLIDFRAIVLENWQLFQDILAYGKTGNKEKRTEWIFKLNELRKIVMHPAKLRLISRDELALLGQYRDWLSNQVQGNEE